MSWVETKSAINSTVGTEKFKPLDKIVEDLILKTANTQAITIDKNGYYQPSDGYIGFSSVEVSVPPSAALPFGFSAFATGEFIPASDLLSIQNIEHGLGVAPNFFYIVRKTMDYVGYDHVVSQQFFVNNGLGISGVAYRLTHTTGTNISQLFEGLNKTQMGVVANDTTFQIKGNSASNGPFAAGKEYLWICGVIDGLGL
jgi:hypothetical protein